MKLLLIGLTLLSIVLSHESFAQNQAVEMTTEQNSVNEVVLHQLELIYGEYYESQILNNPNQIQFFTDFYERCEFIPVEEAPSDIDNISTLSIKDKYNPDEITHDYIDSFDESPFIVLKYQFNFYNETDLYYKIYDTNTALKINKL